MPYRFNRRRRIAPGVRLNISKSGPSVSFGPRGAHYTVGHGRRRTTIGVPGTGLSYTSYSRTHARSRPGARPTAPRPVAGKPSFSSQMRELWSKTPGAKIGYGIVYCILVITIPIGLPLLITGIVQLFRPEWKARALIEKSHKQTGESARALIDQAAALLPQDPEIDAAYAQWFYDNAQWNEATTRWERYLATAPDDWTARGHWAQALLNADRWDEAIAALQSLRLAPLSEDSQATTTAHLGLAFLHKNDPSQALEIVKTAPLQKRILDDGLQQCLYVRGIARYLKGEKARGVQDLDRLYALNAGFSGIVETKAAMVAGTYSLS